MRITLFALLVGLVTTPVFAQDLSNREIIVVTGDAPRAEDGNRLRPRHLNDG